MISKYSFKFEQYGGIIVVNACRLKLENDGTTSKTMLSKNENLKRPQNSCPERLTHDIAVVDIYFGSQFAKWYTISQTATFTDKLASIGKKLQ